MPWVFIVLAVLCLAVAFRTFSMGVALISLLGALGFMLAGVLGLVSARIQSRSRSEAHMISPEEMRLITENMRRKREQEANAAAGGVVLGAAATGGVAAERPDTGSEGGGDGGGGD
jgi:cytochrome c-type biogenesis protein CcmH/NrfG